MHNLMTKEGVVDNAGYYNAYSTPKIFKKFENLMSKKHIFSFIHFIIIIYLV